MPSGSTLVLSQPNELWRSHRPTLLNSPSLHFEDTATARHVLREYFLDTFDTYELLFECLKNEAAYYVKPISLRHPLIFYFGHTATFFINKLLLSKLIPERLNPHFESMFAVGVDEMSWDDLNDAHYDWPSVAEVKDYRLKVRALVLNLIEHASLELPINWQNPWWSIVMAIEHERIHLETSSVLIRQHDLQYVYNHPQWRAQIESHQAPENQLIFVPAASLQRNQNFDYAYYGWDNEYGQHQADVAAFAASQYLVSNHEFLAFVEARGYQNADFWTTEGQAWLQFSQATHPTFWRQNQDGTWRLRLMLEEVDMPWDWPVEVNYLEAKAFCQWKSQHTKTSIRLPTEDEWYRIYEHSQPNATDSQQEANLALRYAPNPSPVDLFQHGDFFDVQGNVWQWTETAIYPFDGFQVHPIYDDFTTPTFDGKHNLIKGGSWISAGNEARSESRYAFRRHFFQHAGFRYVESCNEVSTYHSHYETDHFVSQYLEFQYGTQYFDVENFAYALVQLARPYYLKGPCNKALDLGCATGRASFELAHDFKQVIGLDFSARFIQQADELKHGHTVHYTIPVEGELVEYKACQLKDLALQDIAQRVDFFQADACNLKPQYQNFDFILAANLIDRLHHPKDFLTHIHSRLNIGGILMLSSPYTWLEEHTPKDEWIGGIKASGESLTTLDGITALLAPHFEMIRAPIDVPFVIRETARKFQHTLSQVTLWRRIH